MKRMALYVLKRGLLLLAVFLVGGLALRAWESRDGPPLEPWHTFVPDELDAKALDSATWPDYLQAEDRIFASVLDTVTQRLDPEDRAPFNRYFEGSPVHPARFAHDWNRSFVLEPPVRRSVPWCCCTDSPIPRTACATSPSFTARTDSSRWPSDFLPTAPCRVRSPGSIGRTGSRPPAWPYAKRDEESARRARSTSWATPTAARWR